VNFYLTRNDEAYLVKELADHSLNVELRDGTGTILTFQPHTWRVVDYGWLIPWNGSGTRLKLADEIAKLPDRDPGVEPRITNVEPDKEKHRLCKRQDDLLRKAHLSDQSMDDDDEKDL
jgi:hypothetical protein